MNLPFAPLWVVITGIVRDEALLLMRLAFFDSLRKAGDVSEIVWSTWRGEVDKFPAVADAMRRAGVILVESDEPTVVCRGHYLHQSVSLENGIEICPTNSFILRTRTDKCGPESGFIDEQVAGFLRARSYLQSSSRASLFRYRIGTFGYHTTVSNRSPVLFFWNDRTYAGFKADLKKFVNRNILAFDYQKLIPEQVLFSAPFCAIFPVLNEFFYAVNQSDAVAKILFTPASTPEQASALVEYLCNNELFRHAFLTERLALFDCFYDIPTGAPIEFSTQYADRQVPIDPTWLRSLTNGDFHKFDQDRLKQQGSDLTAYLHRHFGVEPILHRIPTRLNNSHYTFTTPTNSLGVVQATPI